MYSAAGVNQTLSTIGGLAVGVPGELRGEYIETAYSTDVVTHCSHALFLISLGEAARPSW